MAKKVHIDPVTRIEGHLAVSVEVESGKVSKGYCKGEMFRGFETILKGRDPLDAQQITQRICGVCPVSHGMASVLAQEQAYDVDPPENGRIIRNIILGANYIQSHIIHFYHLSALDFIDIKAIVNYKGKDRALNNLKDWVKAELASDSLYPAAPFLPRYEGRYIENTDLNIMAIKNYLDALDYRSLAHKLGATFAGKLPHAPTLIPGGVTEKVTSKKIAACKSMIKELKFFVDNMYLQDIFAVAQAFPEYFNIGKGYGNYLSYGVFPEASRNSQQLFSQGVIIEGDIKKFNVSRITEDVKYSLFSSPSGLSPYQGETIPAPGKDGAYSWIKAPRYGQYPMEVGPLARIMVEYLSGGNQVTIDLVDATLRKTGLKIGALDSVLGRHAVRALECKIVADRCEKWIDELKEGAVVFNDFNICENGKGVGLTEAPRGALGHWMNIKNFKIENYQCIVPTTWNCSPRDKEGTPGVLEKAVVGTPVEDRENPLEAARVVRSFDPCIACAVH